MEACRDCDGHPCEKACLRGRTDRAISITQIVRQLQDMPNPTDSSPLTSSPDLAIDFCGIRCANPFILASSPVAHNYEMCVRALEAGWAGICFKTISFYPSHEVSPRFDQMEVDGVPFIGFKNMEQLSEASVEENFDTLYRLKQRYPDKLIISSIMGRTDDEWTRLAQYSTQAGADIIECNFSCPQMTQEGMGSDVGQSPELVRRFTAATRRGTHLPILAKMTPNIGQMTPVALAAHEGGATGIAAINTIKCITRIDEKALTARPVVCGLSSVSGYSGKAVRPIALRFIHELASDPSAGKMPISGIGGIETWRDALDFLLLGCTNLQICTAVMQYGFRIIDDLCEGLRLFMQENGYKTLSDLIGIALPNIVPPEKLERTQIHRPTVDNSLCLGCGRCFVSCNDGGHQAIRFSYFAKRYFPEPWGARFGGIFHNLGGDWCNASDKYIQGHLMYESPFILLRFLKPNPKAHKYLVSERFYLSQLWTPVLPNYSELGYGIGSDLFHIALFLGFEEFKYQSVGLKFALELFR